MHAGGALPPAALAVLVAAGAVIAATRIAAQQLGERIGEDHARAIWCALFEHAAAIPAGAAAKRRAGYMSLHFVGDMTAFRNWLALGVPRLIGACVLVPAMLAVLRRLDPVLAVALYPVLAMTLLLIAWGGLRLVPLPGRLRARRV
jgi:ABC-type transport system involved in cytochrome bd biosynthesis fused ATPase/permease subunit